MGRRGHDPVRHGCFRNGFWLRTEMAAAKRRGWPTGTPPLQLNQRLVVVLREGRAIPARPTLGSPDCRPRTGTDQYRHFAFRPPH